MSMANVIPFRRWKRPVVGEIFVGRYHVIERLGRGGMGEVWRAVDDKLERIVALKLLHREQLEVPGARERFERESRALAYLEHPNVMPLYDWGTEPVPYIVMKRIEGLTM